jgi:hypothetical protein
MRIAPRLLALGLALACARSAGAEGARPLDRVVILSPAGVRDDMERLRSVLEAYLTDLEVKVSVETVDALPDGLPAQVALARKASLAEGVLSAIWVEGAGSEFFVLVSDRRSERVLVQARPRSPEGWDAECDVIAAMVRSALTPWLGRSEPAPEKIAPPPPRPARVEASEPPRPPWPRLVVAASYSPVLVHSDGPVTHGAAIALGVLAPSWLEVDAQVQILEAARMDVTGEDLRLERWPLALLATGLLSLGALDLGARLGLVVDVTRVSGVSGSRAPDDTNIVNVGFAPSLVVRYRILPWFGLWLDAGVYLFRRDRRYSWSGETAFEYGFVQPRLSAGPVFILPFE